MKKSFALISLSMCLSLFSCTYSKESSAIVASSESSSSKEDSISQGSSVSESPLSSESSKEDSSSVNTYTVSFLNYDQTPLFTDTVVDGGEAVYEGETPVRKTDASYSYAFSGWDKALTNVRYSFATTALYTKTGVSYDVALTNETPEKGALEGSGTFKVGDSVTLKATPNKGFVFEGWYVDGTLASAESEYVFTMPAKNMSISGKFEDGYLVNAISMDETKGTVTGSGYYAEGASVSLVANPIQPYGSVNWIDENGSIVSGDLTYTFTMPKKTVYLIANFSIGKGSYLKVGTYPQSKVTDTDLITELKAKVGTLPSEEAPSNWTDYGYYYGTGENYNTVQASFMWYQDIVEGSDKYRAVYFDKYRPDSNSTLPVEDNSNQPLNGYYINNVYFFKFEDVSWKVLAVKEGKALLWSDLVLDSQPFTNKNKNSTSTYNGEEVYANNYAASFIREFVNGSFYDWAFDGSIKEKINLAKVDNSGQTSYTKGADNPFACEDTNDYIFSLSFEDMIYESYGFNSKYSYLDTARKKTATDYALCQGNDVHYVTDDKLTGQSAYWLRTPDESVKTHALASGANGFTGSTVPIGVAGLGVAPAMWYTL